MNFQRNNASGLCGHCATSHPGGKAVCVLRGAGRHATEKVRQCGGCNNQYPGRPFGVLAPVVSAPVSVAPTPTALPSGVPAARQDRTILTFRAVINIGASTSNAPRRILLDRTHPRIARQYLDYGLVTCTSAKVSVDFGASSSSAVGGLIMTEFTNGAVQSRDYATMREEGGIISTPMQVRGAEETFVPRPGAPSRHFDPAQRSAGGESLCLWIATTFSSAVDVVVEFSAWGQNRTDPNLGRAVDYDPPIVAANAQGWVLQLDRTNPRFATLRLPRNARVRWNGSGDAAVFQVAMPDPGSGAAGTSFAPINLGGNAVTRGNYPGLDGFIVSVTSAGVAAATSLLLKIR